MFSTEEEPGTAKRETNDRGDNLYKLCSLQKTFQLFDLLVAVVT